MLRAFWVKIFGCGQSDNNFSTTFQVKRKSNAPANQIHQNHTWACGGMSKQKSNEIPTFLQSKGTLVRVCVVCMLLITDEDFCTSSPNSLVNVSAPYNHCVP